MLCFSLKILEQFFFNYIIFLLKKINSPVQFSFDEKYKTLYVKINFYFHNNVKVNDFNIRTVVPSYHPN